MGVLLVLAGLTSALPSRRSPLIPPKEAAEKR
jgi:hypothetical protein